MSARIETVETRPATEEELQLEATFAEMKKNQLTRLDEAGKRIIELSTGLLGVLFAVTAFGKDFPPPYLQGNPVTKALAVTTLILYLLALLAGFLSVQPRRYRHYDYNLSSMHSELEKMADYKVFCFRAGSVLFVLGSIGLVTVIIRLILSA